MTDRLNDIKAGITKMDSDPNAEDISLDDVKWLVEELEQQQEGAIYWEDRALSLEIKHNE